MKINFSYGKFIKLDNIPNDSALELPDRSTVRDLLVFLKLPSYLQKSVIVHVNNEPVWNSTILKENDSVTIFRIVSGG